MTPVVAKTWLPLIQAIAAGKHLQYHFHGTAEQQAYWGDTDELNVNLDPKDYRVKPEVKLPTELIKTVNSLRSGGNALAASALLRINRYIVCAGILREADQDVDYKVKDTFLQLSDVLSILEEV